VTWRAFDPAPGGKGEPIMKTGAKSLAASTVAPSSGIRMLQAFDSLRAHKRCSRHHVAIRSGTSCAYRPLGRALLTDQRRSRNDTVEPVAAGWLINLSLTFDSVMAQPINNIGHCRGRDCALGG